MALRGKLWFISSRSTDDGPRTVLDDHGGKLVGSACELVGVFETAEAAQRACRAINRHDALMASLRAVLPYSESRAEDMLDCAEENEATAAGVPESEEAARTAARSRADADKAVAAVDAAKALLASLDAA